MTYEYICTQCQHQWEQEQSISEAAIKHCPKCGQESAKRQVSGGAGFILKGGGWYADGYGSKPAGGGDGKGDKAEKPEKSDKPDKAKKGDDKAASTPSKTDAPKKTSETKSTGGTTQSEASSKAKSSD